MANEEQALNDAPREITLCVNCSYHFTYADKECAECNAPTVCYIRADQPPDGIAPEREIKLLRDIERLVIQRKDLVEALEGFVRAYDRVYPVRTADMHMNGCLCMRCHRDQAANLIAKHRERSDD